MIDEYEKQFNTQLKSWQNKQLRAVRKDYFEVACEKMSDLERGVWERIANAKDYKEINWLVWNNAGRVIDKFYKIACRGR